MAARARWTTCASPVHAQAHQMHAWAWCVALRLVLVTLPAPVLAEFAQQRASQPMAPVVTTEMRVRWATCALADSARAQRLLLRRARRALAHQRQARLRRWHAAALGGGCCASF